MSKTQIRNLHSRFTLVVVIPLFITVISGRLYSVLQYFGLDFFWVMKIHAGNFYFINLQLFSTPFVGFLTILAIISGLFLFPKSKIKYSD